MSYSKDTDLFSAGESTAKFLLSKCLAQKNTGPFLAIRCPSSETIENPFISDDWWG